MTMKHRVHSQFVIFLRWNGNIFECIIICSFSVKRLNYKILLGTLHVMSLEIETGTDKLRN